MSVNDKKETPAEPTANNVSSPENKPAGRIGTKDRLKKLGILNKRIALLLVALILVAAISTAYLMNKKSSDQHAQDNSEEASFRYIDNTPAQDLTVEVHRLAAEKKYDQAITLAQQELEKDLNPDDKYSALTLLGDMQHRKGAYEEAIATLEQAVAIKNDRPRVAATLAESAEKIGDLGKAIKWHEEAVRLYEAQGKEESAYYAEIHKQKLAELRQGPGQ